MAISFLVSLLNGAIGTIRMAPMATNGDRHWRSPLAPMAMGYAIGAIFAITIGANGYPLSPFSVANGAIGEMSDSL